jgi:hypothetical protein
VLFVLNTHNQRQFSTVGCNVIGMTTENTIIIKHYETSFFKRLAKYFWFYLIIVIVFIFLFFLKSESISFVEFISVIIGLFGLSFILNLFDISNYLVDFYSDTTLVKIRYFKYNNEYNLSTTLDKISVKLINTTSFRSGFKCELEINIENLKFKVNNEFDWNLIEIKSLFEYIQEHKLIKLTKEDKFILDRISKTI